MFKLLKLKPSIMLTAVIAVFLSTSLTGQAQLYINGPLVGGSTSDYSTPAVKEFSHDSENDYYYFNFDRVVGTTSEFSISEGGESLSDWKTNSYYSNTDWSPNKFFIRKEYPLIKNTTGNMFDSRIISLGGTYRPISGKKYCIIVKLGINPVMFVQEGYYKPGCTDHIFITGNFNQIGSGYEFLQYDPDAKEYYYTSVGNSGNVRSSFTLYDAGEGKQPYIKPDTADKGINYQLYHNLSSGTSQSLNTSSTSIESVTLHVSGDKSLLWFTENNADGSPMTETNKTLYLGLVNDYDGTNPVSLTGSDGVYTYSLGHLANAKKVYISTTKGYTGDTDKKAGFRYGMMKFNASSLEPGDDADIISESVYSETSEFIELQPGFNARLEINLNNNTVTYYADTELNLYITGPVTGHNFDNKTGATSYTMDEYNYGEGGNVEKFIFQDNVYHYTFTAATTKQTYSYDNALSDISNSFTMSTALGSYSDWDHGGYRTDRTTYGTDINAGRKYPLNTEEAVRFIKKSDGSTLTNDQKYTIYVTRDFSKVWVEEGEYSNKVATSHDIYLKGSGVNNENGYGFNNVASWKFKYDEVHDYYYLKVPRNIVTASMSGNGNVLATKRFQISTEYGSEPIWDANSILITNPDRAVGDGHTHIPGANDKEVRMGNKYDIEIGNAATATSNGKLANFIMHDYHVSTAYTFYISGDLKKMWVQPDVFVIGWLTGGYNNYKDPATNTDSTIKQLEFDPVLGRYVHTFAGSSASVFELSTAVSGSNYYFTPTADWYDGMLCYITYKDNGEKNDQPDMATMPRTADTDADITLPENAPRYYELDEGWAISVDRGSQYNLKNDQTVLGYSPNNLYRLNVSADLKHMWITEQPINMPLNGRDFYDDGLNPVPHYFLVGTRTADWRLLPEWEIKTNGTANPLSGTLSGRFMYDGYFAIAKVPSYMDYIHHRYEVFSNSLESPQNYKDATTPITLTSYGNSGALHYTADDPVHDSHNSITWNLDPEDHSDNGTPTDNMMRLSVPYRISELNLTIDGSCNPTSVSFSGSTDREVINTYRTFTLVGEHINYEGLFDFENAYGKRDLREMSSTYKTVHEKNWANSWISYDKYANPYYDAFGNTLYKTAYDIDWARNHDVYFDITVGGKDLIINSKNYRFTLADNFTDDDLAADPYSNLYKVHPRLDDLTPNAGASRQIGDGETGQVLTNAVDNSDNYTKAYTEFLVTNYTGEGSKYGTWGSTYQSKRPDETYETLESDWRCYVIKDVWLKGDFKAWTGWGGNLSDREGWAFDSNSNETEMRWYFGNFGHSQATTAYEVKGFDPLAGNSSDNHIKVYQTYRDVKDANFRTFGYNDSDPNSGLQYYNRVILWYNANTGSRKNAEEPNAVLQLVQSSAQPSIRAFHKPGTSNYIDTEWTLVDHTETHVYDHYDVVSYQIIRYRVVTDGEGNQHGEPYRTFNAVPLHNVKVSQLIPETGIIEFSDPYALGQGSYYYQLLVTIEDPNVEDSQTVLVATSNTVPINAASKPVLMEADQIKNVDKVSGETIYSFDLRVKTYPNDDADIYEYTSHYTYNVVEDLEYLEISVDKHTAEALNNAGGSVENRDLIKITTLDKLHKKNNEATFISSYKDEDNKPCVGFVLSEETSITNVGETERHPYFKPMNDGSGRYHIVFNMINRYQKNGKGDELRFFSFGHQLQEWIEFPIIKWNNVQPTENIKFHIEEKVVGEDDDAQVVIEEVDGDDAQYIFKAHLGPAAEYEAHWRDYNNFKDDEHSTSIYAPSPTGTLSGLNVRRVSEEIGVDTDNASVAFMPPGAVSIDSNNNLVAHSPVYYNQANEVVAKIKTDKVPVYEKVFDNNTVSLKVGVYNTVYDVDGHVEVNLSDEGGKTYTGWIHNLPMFNDNDAVQSGYTSYMPIRSTRFQPSISAVYKNENWTHDIYTNDRITTNDKLGQRLDLSNHSAPDFVKTSRVQINSTSGDIVLGVYKIFDKGRADTDKWYGCAIIGLEQNSRSEISNLDGLHTVYGFHAPSLVEYAGGYLSPHSFTGHVAAPNFDRSESATVRNGISMPDYQKYYPTNSDNNPIVYDHDTHNWAKITANNRYIPIVIDPVCGPFDEAPTAEDFKSITVNIDLYEMFPFVSHSKMFASDSSTETLAEHNTRASVRARVGEKESTPALNHNDIRPMGLAVTKVEPLKGGVLTGVEGIGLDDSDVEPIYYNIQGLRIDNPIPGQVYIVRRGTTVTKEYIR